MKYTTMLKTFTGGAALVAALTLAAAPSQAVTYNLRADKMTLAAPGGNITFWGFALDNGPVTVPGPRLTVPPGDSTLTINLTNNLPRPVSIIIPGQAQNNGQPVTFTDTAGRKRARSLTKETAAKGGSATYTWKNFRPGTYIYHSASQMQVQVQMGLYGPATKDHAAGMAYPGVAYDNEVLLFYSEIDEELHQAVATNQYGVTVTSTIDYVPEYFLVNGMPYIPGRTPAVPAGQVGQRTLLRLLNVGYNDHGPTLQGDSFYLAAEDGNRSSYALKQFSLRLSAGKTRDLIWVPSLAGTYPFYDRFMQLTNKGQPYGGMFTPLKVTN